MEEKGRPALRLSWQELSSAVVLSEYTMYVRPATQLQWLAWLGSQLGRLSVHFSAFLCFRPPCAVLSRVVLVHDPEAAAAAAVEAAPLNE